MLTSAGETRGERGRVGDVRDGACAGLRSAVGRLRTEGVDAAWVILWTEMVQESIMMEALCR